MRQICFRQVPLVIMLSILFLSACSRKPELVPFSGPVSRVQTVLVATSRRVETADPLTFGGVRANDNLYASYQISVPPNREPGDIRLPRGRPDPAQDFLFSGLTQIENRRAFITEVNKTLETVPYENRHVTIFVHGFNVGFPAAVLRSAQIAEDFQIGGPMVLYSWPSADRLSQYVYDRGSALFARDRFAATLRVLSETDAHSIQILAHSMGGFLTMETLRTLANTKDQKVLNKIQLVTLAEPDIDMDVFRAQIAPLDLDHMGIIVIGSHKDRALRLSQFVAGGHPRVGEADNIEELQRLGVAVVDVSGARDGTLVNHNAFARNPELVELIGSGELAKTILAGSTGENIVVGGLHAIGNVALAIAHIPYQLVD